MDNELSIWSKMNLNSHLPDELIIDTNNDQEDDDEDDDDTYLYDEPPASYDVEARLKEINAALAKQFLPDDPETRLRRVKFRDNPVESQIPPEVIHCSAAASSDDDDDDDGYGASDDMEDGTTLKTQIEDLLEAKNLTLELEKVLTIEENEPEREDSIPKDDKQEVSQSDPDVDTQSQVDTNLEEVRIEDETSPRIEDETLPEIESLVVTNPSEELKTTSDGTFEVETNIPIEETEEIQVLTPEEEEGITNTDITTETNRKENRRLLESRPCSSPPRIKTPKSAPDNCKKVEAEEEEEEEEETMVMASEGKFHIVNITNMSSKAVQNIERPKTATVERLPMQECPPLIKKHRTQSSNMLQKLKKTYLGNGKITSSSNNRHEILTKPRQRIGYGLTAEQKKERERKLEELSEKRKLKEEQEMEERREKKEKGESAFREWLNQKKKIPRTTLIDVDKVQFKSKDDENEVGSSEAFRKWLRRKREEKEEERKLEELRLRQEEEIFCKKTREENEKAFKQWLLRKSRTRQGGKSYGYNTDGRSRVDSGQVRPILTFRSSIRRAKLNTLRKTLQMIPNINKIHHL